LIIVKGHTQLVRMQWTDQNLIKATEGITKPGGNLLERVKGSHGPNKAGVHRLTWFLS